jgi:hypothetical protein
MANGCKAFRLPRKGDRVRMWVLGEDRMRRRVEVTVMFRRDGYVHFRWDHEDEDQGHHHMTPAREMEIL